MKSIWKSTYIGMDKHGSEDYTIREDNGWVKVWDSMIGELPIIGMFTGYILNPSYTLTDKGRQQNFSAKEDAFIFSEENLCCRSLLMYLTMMNPDLFFHS